jgi:hypothetical protein
MSKVAFLFLIYDEINHEELWHRFFKSVNPDKYSIYIHYKENKPLKYFEDNKLKDTVSTKYGDISLVHAQIRLLNEAYKDEKNTRFVFLSNSCIPVKKFDYIHAILTNVDYNHFGIAPQSQCFPRCNSMLKFLDAKDIYKASQWCSLKREDVALILEDKIIISFFEGIFAPDEHYFITFLKLKGSKIRNYGTTFVNWEDSEDPDGCSPKTYYTISDTEMRAIKKSTYMFARKFAKDCVVMVPIKDHF